MLKDHQRNDFYAASLRATGAGRRALDVGAGTGLLSLLAAKAGDEVLSVEAGESRWFCD